MNNSDLAIPLWNLALAFIPAIAGLLICYRWSRNFKRAGYSLMRMLVQLLLIGYLLTFIFETNSPFLVMGILLLMLGASSWIAAGSLGGSISRDGFRYVKYSLLSIAAGGSFTLALVTQGVLQLDPWYLPQFIIPLAGMIFANSMNTVSLAAERLHAEFDHDVAYPEARAIAFNAALIPNINSMFAVGLVSLPGMMTGQILSGVSPLIAVRYQIMVMCMIFGSSAISAACFLMLAKPRQ
ncbi:MAG: ABC transporter permease [Granulosicoccus sp.]